MLTNSGNISLPIAVWLASDDYDLSPRPNVISATGLLKPLKSIVLTQRIREANLEGDTDLQDLVPSRLGTAIHAAVEHSWLHHLSMALTAMGIPEHAQKLVRVNPTLPVDPNNHNIFIEQRAEREIDGFIVSGKYDFVENGRVKDVKSTGTYNWVHGGNDSKYAMQGSIYKWLNPAVITDDVMDVEFVFTDWKAISAKTDKSYPANRVMTRTLPLKSEFETEAFITNKISQLKTYHNKPESEIPDCTPDELWQRPAKWAYYKNPMALKRATKVFDTQAEAVSRQVADKSVGIIQHRPGEVKFCIYCPARPICKQAERLQQAGLLVI